MVLNVAQTWHQVRPGEVRNDCGGCHAHSQQPLAFAAPRGAARLSGRRPQHDHAAAVEGRAGNPSVRTVNAPMVTVEFLRDIRPLLQRSCVPATARTRRPGGQLVLDNYSARRRRPRRLRLPRRRSERAVRHQAAGEVGSPVWRQTNASRYVRMFPDRRSLLMEALRAPPRRLDQRRSSDEIDARQPGHAPRRRRDQRSGYRLHRSDDAAAGQRTAAQRREDAVRAGSTSAVRSTGRRAPTAGSSTTCGRAST